MTNVKYVVKDNVRIEEFKQKVIKNKLIFSYVAIENLQVSS